jgi:hypothetical protein
MPDKEDEKQNRHYEIFVDDGQKRKCPKCGGVFAIENSKEILYRNITLLHFNKSTGAKTVKCKQCKNLITG